MRFETNDAGVSVPVFDGMHIRIDPNSKYNAETNCVEDRDTYPTIEDMVTLDDKVGTPRHERFDVNTGLTQDQARDMEAAVFMEKTMTLKARRLLPVTQVKPSALMFTYTKRSHMSDAEIVGIGQSIPTDLLTKTQTNVYLQKIAKGANLPMEWIAGTDMISAHINTIVRQVGELENNICYQSLTLPDVDGLIDDAGNTAGAASAWSNAVGTSLPMTDIAGLIALCGVDGFEGDNFVMALDPTNKAEGEKHLLAAGDGGLPAAKQAGLIKDYFADNNVPHATAVLVLVDRTIATLAVAEDVTVIIDNPNRSNQTQLITCHERVAPAIMQPNGVATLTGM